MNTFQRWIFHRGEYIFWGNIFRGEYFSGVNILQNEISTKIFPPQNFPFVHHYFWGRAMCQLNIFPFEFHTVERCLVLNTFPAIFFGLKSMCNMLELRSFSQRWPGDADIFKAVSGYFSSSNLHRPQAAWAVNMALALKLGLFPKCWHCHDWFDTPLVAMSVYWEHLALQPKPKGWHKKEPHLVNLTRQGVTGIKA